MKYRIVKVTNQYNNKVHFRIQYRVPIFGWWWYTYNDCDYGGWSKYELIENAHMVINNREAHNAKEVVEVMNDEY